MPGTIANYSTSLGLKEIQNILQPIVTLCYFKTLQNSSMPCVFCSLEYPCYWRRFHSHTLSSWRPPQQRDAQTHANRPTCHSRWLTSCPSLTFPLILNIRLAIEGTVPQNMINWFIIIHSVPIIFPSLFLNFLCSIIFALLSKSGHFLGPQRSKPGRDPVDGFATSLGDQGRDSLQVWHEDVEKSAEKQLTEIGFIWI